MNLPANRTQLKHAVTSALARLRVQFPLEARLAAAGDDERRAYKRVLEQWLQSTLPMPGLLAAEHLAALIRLDAVVATGEGLGCYPFSARPTGIDVRLPRGTVPAMCAIDALAIARLAGSPVSIAAGCAICGGAITCRVEADGSLDHDQAEVARVLWRNAAPTQGACADHLCRNLLFLCPNCEPPAGDECFTLPQATVIGNAFFSFQLALLRAPPVLTS